MEAVSTAERRDALRYACFMAGRVAPLRELLPHCADDLNVIHKGCTPLTVAVEGGITVVRLILAAKTDARLDDRAEALLKACYYGSAAMIEVLLPRSGINAADDFLLNGSLNPSRTSKKDRLQRVFSEQFKLGEVQQQVIAMVNAKALLGDGRISVTQRVIVLTLLRKPWLVPYLLDHPSAARRHFSVPECTLFAFVVICVEMRLTIDGLRLQH